MKTTFKFKNLIGFRLDTNQFTSKTIENGDEAKMYVDKVIKLYGLENLKYMFLTEHKTFTSYKKHGVSLFQVLNP